MEVFNEIKGHLFVSKPHQKLFRVKCFIHVLKLIWRGFYKPISGGSSQITEERVEIPHCKNILSKVPELKCD